MSEKYLVVRGEGSDRRWLDGKGPLNAVYSWTPVRADATEYGFLAAKKIAYRAWALLGDRMDLAVELAEPLSADEFITMRQIGQG